MRSFEEQQVYTVINTAPIREEVARQTEEFLARGGKIKILKREESKAASTDPNSFSDTELSKLISQIKDSKLGKGNTYVFHQLKTRLGWNEVYLKARIKALNDRKRAKFFEEGLNLPKRKG